MKKRERNNKPSDNSQEVTKEQMAYAKASIKLEEMVRATLQAEGDKPISKADLMIFTILMRRQIRSFTSDLAKIAGTVMQVLQGGMNMDELKYFYSDDYTEYYDWDSLMNDFTKFAYLFGLDKGDNGEVLNAFWEAENAVKQQEKK